MARQILDGCIELHEFGNTLVRRIELGVAELALDGFPLILEPPLRDDARELAEFVWREAEDLADIARGAASAIADDICSHRRAMFAVTLVDVLNDALPLIAARKVDVDVGHFAALFGEETFEEKLHFDWVNGCDAKRIADRAIGRGAASLGENSLLFTEAHDIPDGSSPSRCARSRICATASSPET